MKISMVSEHASPLATPGSVDAGGQNVHVSALSRALARRGHSVTVYTRRDDPEMATRVPFDDGVSVVHVPAGPSRRLSKDDLLPHMGEFAAGLAAAWAADLPDVVHSHFWMSGLASVDAVNILEKGSGTGALRSSLPHIAHTFHALGSVKRRYQGAADTSPTERTWLEPRVGRDVDRVIATCPDEVTELEALGIPRQRIDIAPCGVDLAEFGIGGPVDESHARFRILSVGRLVPRKGVDLIVRAIALLRSRGCDDVELEIVGSSGGVESLDPEIARLSALAHELQVSDRVHFRHQLPREQIPSLLRSADAVVCTPWYEPFGIVPLESMACGTPVIVAAVGGLADSVINGVTGMHVPPHDPEAIAAALETLLASDERRKQMGIAGRERVEARYSWERVAKLTESIYENMRRRTRLPRTELREMAS